MLWRLPDAPGKLILLVLHHEIILKLVMVSHRYIFTLDCNCIGRTDPWLLPGNTLYTDKPFLNRSNIPS